MEDIKLIYTLNSYCIPTIQGTGLVTSTFVLNLSNGGYKAYSHLHLYCIPAIEGIKLIHTLNSYCISTMAGTALYTPTLVLFPCNEGYKFIHTCTVSLQQALQICSHLFCIPVMKRPGLLTHLQFQTQL